MITLYTNHRTTLQLVKEVSSLNKEDIVKLDNYETHKTSIPQQVKILVEDLQALLFEENNFMGETC